MQHWISQNRALESAIDAAVSWSYESVRPIEARS